ncbi:MAG: hypothetical protein H5U40_01375 [Polyangiaceae bacterium]|nr:hypothetical protein [Polyangiaceae bacterium]
MERSPADRFGSAAEMLNALLPFGAIAPPLSDGFREAHPPRRRPSSPAPSIRRSDLPPAGPAPSIPLPQDFLALPRLFEAQSADWKDDFVQPVATPPSALPAITGTSTPRRSDEGSRVVGALVGVALYLARESFGIPGLERILSSLPAESAFRLRGPVMTVPWVPGTLVGDLARSADSTFGLGNGTIAVDLGKRVALRVLATTHKHLAQNLAPNDAVQRIPRIWRSFHDGGDVVVGRAQSGTYLVQVSGHVPTSLAHAQFMAGFYAGLLETTGARDAQAHVLACVELGTARTVTELKWR